LCDKYKTALQESHDAWESDFPIPPPAPSPPAPTTSPTIDAFRSEILDALGRVSIDKMVDLRQRHQSGTSTRSECAVRLDPKFDKQKPADDDPDKDSLKHRIKELSHRVHIAQDLDKSKAKSKTA